MLGGEESSGFEKQYGYLTRHLSISRLLSNFLGFSFSRQSEQERIPVHVAPIVKEACHLLRASLPSTIDLRLNVSADASFSTTPADPTQIHQVLMNLCTNAGYAMREKGGTLEISLCNLELGEDFVSQYMQVAPGPYLRLSVSDTGPGA